MSSAAYFVAGFFVALVGAILVFFKRRRRGRGSSARTTAVHGGIQELKAIGHLSVFKVLTKEIVTEVDHTWGEIGKKYLNWILSARKMAMIFMFEIDFRYDLHHPDFEIVESGSGCLFRMPPCQHEINIRDILFYDEQKSKLIPWLLPDLINSVFGSGFTEENKNRLKDAARQAATTQAETLISDLSSEVEQSAKQTLGSMARAFGAETTQFEFARPAGPDPA